MLPLQDFLTPPPPTATLPPAGGAAAGAANAAPTPIPTPFPTPALPVGPGTPAPAAGAPVTTPVTEAAQTTNLAALVALFIYLVFFAVMGYRRGTQRELIVLLVALGTSFVLQQFSSVFITLFDRFGKGLAFITGQPIPEQSGLGAWAAANTATLLTLLWLAVVVFTYLFTNRYVRKSKKDGWAAIVGVLNGLVFGSIFAPLLTTLIFPDIPIRGPIIQLPVLGFLTNIWDQIAALAARMWVVIQPVATNVFFLAVILLILLAALTLRTSAKPKT